MSSSEVLSAVPGARCEGYVPGKSKKMSSWSGQIIRGDRQEESMVKVEMARLWHPPAPLSLNPRLQIPKLEIFKGRKSNCKLLRPLTFQGPAVRA